jgi:hypothetical protein
MRKATAVWRVILVVPGRFVGQLSSTTLDALRELNRALRKAYGNRRVLGRRIRELDVGWQIRCVEVRRNV